MIYIHCRPFKSKPGARCGKFLHDNAIEAVAFCIISTYKKSPRFSFALRFDNTVTSGNKLFQNDRISGGHTDRTVGRHGARL